MEKNISQSTTYITPSEWLPQVPECHKMLVGGTAVIRPKYLCPRDQSAPNFGLDSFLRLQFSCTCYLRSPWCRHPRKLFWKCRSWRHLFSICSFDTECFKEPQPHVCRITTVCHWFIWMCYDLHMSKDTQPKPILSCNEETYEKCMCPEAQKKFHIPLFFVKISSLLLSCCWSRGWKKCKLDKIRSRSVIHSIDGDLILFSRLFRWISDGKRKCNRWDWVIIPGPRSHAGRVIWWLMGGDLPEIHLIPPGIFSRYHLVSKSIR